MMWNYNATASDDFVMDYGGDTSTTLFATRSRGYGFHIVVVDDLWRSSFLEDFEEALKRCHDALRQLIVPWLRSLRRPASAPLSCARQAFDLVFSVAHRPRSREIVSRGWFRNFHK